MNAFDILVYLMRGGVPRYLYTPQPFTDIFGYTHTHTHTERERERDD